LNKPEDLEFSQLESQQKLQLITDLNNQITQMRQRLGNQRIEIEVLRIRWKYDFVRNLYEEERKNEDLLEKRRLQFANQGKRIAATVEIAEAERMSCTMM
jgi:hypothetical protein